MMRLSVLLIFCTSLWVSCDGNQPSEQEPRSDPTHPGWETYIDIRNTLQDSGQALGYDALMHTHNTMIETEHQIPHMDQLLVSLINKRNHHPRMDQMILIFAAHALGSSKFPVPDARGIFEKILAKEDRLSAWVLSFVAEAIGDYRADIPGGGKLVDRLEAKLAMVVSSDPEKEDFGHHFLPPPKGRYIPSYIENIKSMSMRVSERRHYYYLVANGYTEAEIEKAFVRIQSNGIPAKAERSFGLLMHLAMRPDQLGH